MLLPLLGYFYWTMHRPDRVRFLRASWAAALFAGAAFFFSAKAEAVRVRVLATTRLEGRVDRNIAATRSVVIRGTLRDDVGHPVADNHVSITFYDSTVRDAPARLSESPQRCADAPPTAARAHVAPDEYVIDTDALGSFCLQTTLPIDRGTMKLRFLGNSFYEGTASEISFDLTRPSVLLAFDPEPSIASLDRTFFSVGLRVTAPNVPKDGWRVVLKDEKERVLGSADVDPDGLVRIDVPTDKLGDPGPGELSAALEGTPLVAQHVSHAIERHARVDLALVSPNPRGTPEDGIPIGLRVRSSRGWVAAGSVEATMGQRSIGAAAVRAGHAGLVATFASTRQRSAQVSIRYLSDAPWWEPGSALTVAIGIDAPSVWRRMPAVLLALAVAAFMTRGSWLPRLARVSRRRGPAPRATEQNALEITRKKAPDEGWSGQVIDAHDGNPLEAAIVSIVVPSFPGSSDAAGPAAEVVTNSAGHFSLEPASFSGKALIRVRAPRHATFERPLPAPSEVTIPMIARRRRLLDRLVAWALRELGPWRGASEPTPGQVATRAHFDDRFGRERAADVEAWARAVESTAFGRDDVDEHAERSVASLEPSRTRGRDP